MTFYIKQTSQRPLTKFDIPVFFTNLSNGNPYYQVKIIAEFLYSRTLIVKVDGANSRMSKIEYGVPQGAVLIPTLFIKVFFINYAPVKNDKDETTLLF